MNILAFDTSTEKFSITILKNNKVVLNLSKSYYPIAWNGIFLNSQWFLRFILGVF